MVTGTSALGSVTCNWTATACAANGGLAQAPVHGISRSPIPTLTLITTTGASTNRLTAGTGSGPAACPSAGMCFEYGETNNPPLVGMITPVTSGHLGTPVMVAGTAFVVWLTCPEPGSCVGVGGAANAPGGQSDADVFTFSYAG